MLNHPRAIDTDLIGIFDPLKDIVYVGLDVLITVRQIANR